MFKKLTDTIYLDYILKILGAAVFGITVWKGVHGFFVTSGLVAGVAMYFAGTHFAKIYRV